MKIKENVNEVVYHSFSALVKGEVYKDGNDRVYMRSPYGIVNLTTGEHIPHARVTSAAVFVHYPEATLVLS